MGEELQVMPTLKEMRIGSSGKVLGISGNSVMKHRIMEMGLTPGTDVYVHKLAPLGDPIEISLRGYSLSLRKADAALVLMDA